MKVTRVYMDLQEWVPSKKSWKTVWKLESEAFKKPLELEIHYDNTELKQFYEKVKEVTDLLEKKQEYIELLEEKIDKLEKKHERLLDWYLTSMNQVTELAEQNGEQNDIINATIKELWNTKITVEQQSGTILQANKRINEIEKKISKQPSVFNDKMFVSGHEMVYIWPVQVPNGDYVVIRKVVVGEHNEYVTNEDEILFEKVHVEDWYYLTYQLEWWTDLDTPTATIYYTLVFIPC